MKISLLQQPIELTDGNGTTLATIDLIDLELFIEKIENEPLPSLDSKDLTIERINAIIEWIKEKTELQLMPAQAMTLAQEARALANAFKKKLYERCESLATAECP